MARGLKVKVGSFDVGTGTGNKVVTGIGFAPKALILYSVAAPSAGFQTSFWTAIGFVTATEAYCVATYSADAAADSNTSRRMAAKAISFVSINEAQGPEANLASFDSDGFTLNFTTNPWNSTLVNYIAIGGEDITNAKIVEWTVPTTSIDKAVTGVGFKPDCVLHISSWLTAALPASATVANMSLGAMDRHGNQWVDSFYAATDAATTDTARLQRTDRCLGEAWSLATDYGFSTFKSMDSDGFTTTFSETDGTASRVISLCLRGGSYKVGSLTAPNTIAYQSVGGVGFEPKGLLISGINGSDGTFTHGLWSLGAASSALDQRGIAIRDENGQVTTDVQGYQNNYIYSGLNNATPSTLDGQATLASFDNNGMTLNWLGATNSKILYLAFGNTVVEDTTLDAGTKVKVGSFSLNASTGLQQITGLGFRPKALILYSAGKGGGTGFENSYFAMLGFATGGGKEFAVSATSGNGGTPSDTGRRMAAKILTIIGGDGATLQREADLESFDSDGFTLNVTTAGGMVFNYIAIGGIDLTDANVVRWGAPAGATTKAVTGVGFRPDLALHSFGGISNATALPSSVPHAVFSLGAMDKDGNQWMNAFTSEDAAATSNTSRGQRTDSCIGEVLANATAFWMRASYLSMDADGFSTSFATTTHATDMGIVSLCLKGPQFKVGSFAKTVSTSTPVSQPITGLKFKPKGLIFSTVFTQGTLVSSTSPQPHVTWTLGAASGVGAEKVIAVRDEDAVGTTDVQGYQNDSVLSLLVDATPSTINAEADIASLDSDGFTLSWPIQANTAALEQLYIGIGDAAASFIGWGIPIK